MSSVQEKISIPADRAGLASLRETLRRLCDQSGVRPHTAWRVILAIDEAAANVMEHARVDDGSPVEISVDIGEEDIVVQISDAGISFDPSARSYPQPICPKGKKRGFGLYLMQLITDSLQYRRTDDGRNVLTLTIRGR